MILSGLTVFKVLGSQLSRIATTATTATTDISLSVQAFSATTENRIRILEPILISDLSCTQARQVKTGQQGVRPSFLSLPKELRLLV